MEPRIRMMGVDGKGCLALRHCEFREQLRRGRECGGAGKGTAIYDGATHLIMAHGVSG